MKTRMELSKLYDNLYDKGNKLIKKYNPCQIKNGICITKEKCCCHGCDYLTKKGCSVKALSCKLFLCNNVRFIGKNNWKLDDKLEKLREIARENGLYFYRASKEDTIKELIVEFRR